MFDIRNMFLGLVLKLMYKNMMYVSDIIEGKALCYHNSRVDWVEYFINAHQGGTHV